GWVGGGGWGGMEKRGGWVILDGDGKVFRLQRRAQSGRSGRAVDVEMGDRGGRSQGHRDLLFDGLGGCGGARFFLEQRHVRAGEERRARDYLPGSEGRAHLLHREVG